MGEKNEVGMIVLSKEVGMTQNMLEEHYSGDGM